jgi:hypothetical protein
MTHDARSLAEALIARGVLRGEAAPMPQASSDRPWFVSLVLGAAGWLAGIFVLAFVAQLFEPDSAAELAPIGLVLLAAAFGLYAIDRESAFFDQLALALSIAGQLALVWAADEATDSTTGTALLALLQQLFVLAVMPNRLARALAAFFACIAWALTIRFAWWGESALGETQVDDLPQALLSWLVIWGPLLGAAYALIRSEAQWMASGLRAVARPALAGLLASLSLAVWATEPFIGAQLGESDAEPSSWLALWPLLAVFAALFAAYCAFRVRSRPLIGLAIAGALLHVSQFYYLIGTTLLIKSCLMLAAGVALLAAAHVSQREPAS